jgi:NADH-quinone oxidoreductase subunit E
MKNELSNIRNADTEYVKELARKWQGKEGNLIMILHEVQNHYGYIPRDTSLHLSDVLSVPLARIYEVITFYNYFKLDPPGKHHISVCMGTACYLNGAPEILREVMDVLHIEAGYTSEDGNFYLDTVRCLGCCGLAPVLMIDGKIYGKVKKSAVMDILSHYTEVKEHAEAKSSGSGNLTKSSL